MCGLTVLRGDELREHDARLRERGLGGHAGEGRRAARRGRLGRRGARAHAAGRRGLARLQAHHFIARAPNHSPGGHRAPARGARAILIARLLPYSSVGQYKRAHVVMPRVYDR